MHFPKAKLLIEVIPFGIVIDDNPEHPSKVDESIIVNNGGVLNVIKLEHL